MGGEINVCTYVCKEGGGHCGEVGGQNICVMLIGSIIGRWVDGWVLMGTRCVRSEVR